MSLSRKNFPARAAAPALVLLMSGILFSVSGATWASTQVAAPTQKPAKSSLPAKVRFIESSSTESPAARTKRLKKECKGRPNAGMCLGHTQ